VEEHIDLQGLADSVQELQYVFQFLDVHEYDDSNDCNVHHMIFLDQARI
jgi:hypothetical protein